MAGGQGSGSAMYAAISLVLLAMVQCAMAASYEVGGSAMWNLNVDYRTWAESITFKVGDTLVFTYSPELHSVFQVDEANYKTCTITNALKSYQTGKDSIMLTDATAYYYICGTPNHCNSGMAVTIAVSGGSTSPAPSLSPAPKVSPLPSPPKAAPSRAPVHAPSPSPIAHSPSKTSPSPSPSPSEAIPPPASSSETSPSPSGTAASPTSPSGVGSPPTAAPSNARSTLHSGNAVLLSAILILAGFSLFF